MAVSFVAAGTFQSGTGTVTPGIPAGVLADDFLLLVCHSQNSASVTTPGGYSVIFAQAFGNVLAAGGGAVSTFYKRAVGGDTAITTNDSGDHTAAQYFAFRGVDWAAPSAPYDSGGGAAPGRNAVNVATASISVVGPFQTSTAGAMAIAIVANATDIATAEGPASLSDGTRTLTELGGTSGTATANTVSGTGGGFSVYGSPLTPAVGSCGPWTGTLVTSSVQGHVYFALAPLSVSSDTLMGQACL